MLARLPLASLLIGLFPSLAFAQSGAEGVGRAQPPTPYMDYIGEQFVVAEDSLRFEAHCWDDWGDALFLVADALPVGATFNDLGMGYGSFEWTPTVGQVGDHSVTIRCSNNQGFEDATEAVLIHVFRDQTSVVLQRPIGPFTARANELVSFSVSCLSAGPVGAKSLSATTLPVGATFVDYGSGVASFEWRPTEGDIGTHELRITCRGAAGQSDSELVRIDISPAPSNRPPVLARIPIFGVELGATLDFTASAVDPDGDALIYSLANAPAGAAIDSSDGHFRWTPDSPGAYTLEVSVTDSGSPRLSDSQTVSINVTEARNMPVDLQPLDAQGCGCSTSDTSRSTSGAYLLAGLIAASFVRRRRRV